MKTLLKFEAFLNESIIDNAVFALNEAMSPLAKDLKDDLDAIARDFWRKMGAKYGSVQKKSDIKIPKGCTVIDRDNSFEFKTSSAEIERGDQDDSVKCILWVRPLDKNGKEKLPVKLASFHVPRGERGTAETRSKK